MSPRSSWFAVTLEPLRGDLSADQFDGLCSDLVDLGAAGTAVDQAPLITCYLEGLQEHVDAFISKAVGLQLRLVSVSHVAQENWTGACPDVWEPIRVGALEVFPVESLSDQRPVSPGAIRIIPGLGFGTGHHATTRMVLSALCEFARTADAGQPMTIFDLGTGSGILAIAAARVFGVAVEGNDVELGAIENARDNIALNNVGHLVSVSTDPLESFSGPYDLVLANLYGEVLMKLAPEISRLTRPGSTAILSGITEIVWDQVWQVYGGNFDWELISEQSDTGWMCAVIRRRFCLPLRPL
ncbi:MAG: 50S ribosomal protein L11 methyltransferase [Pseudomonadota bacterium]|jgi:ribosomal protein L11 methyltransferase